MGRTGRLATILLPAVCAVAACGRVPLTLPTSTATGGGSSGTGGDLGSGGATNTGGTTGSGGSTSSGGPGGDGGSGGATSAGGTAGSGGSTISGGATTSTGGATHSAGSGGNGGLGGTTATGGAKASGGSTGSGGLGGGTAGTTTGGTKASGGTVGTGGSSSGGAGGAFCSNVQPCGGDVVGTWTVASSCLEVTGKLDMSEFGLNCAPAPVTGSLQVTGTWIANSNGTYSDHTTTTGSETFALAASCLQISGITITCDRVSGLFQSIEYQSVGCTPAAGGGCTCAATVNQTGWAGVLSFDASTSGTYKTAGNAVTLDDEANYSYCVSGNRMTWTPQSTSPTTTGTIAFQK